MISFYKTISDPILTSIERGNRRNSEEEPLIIKIEKKKQQQPMNSKLSVILSNVNFELYKYDLKENNAFRLSALGIFLNLGLAQTPEGQMFRKLQLSLKPINLAKMVVDKAGAQQLRSILKLPLIKGELDTTQKSHEDTQIQYNFITTFDGLIDPSLNLSDYEQLVTAIKFAVGQVKIGNGETGNQKIEEDEKPKVAYTFIPVQYQFNPGFKVGIGASFSPDISWLLNLFGISDAHIIPASLFEYVCLGLESFLRALAGSIAMTE
ncbi:hypothetical protein GPJ56_003133 [Histomonas meleagridis]|uniref:uncharacterized protein n=1 Tax=Histomonas meleagridis TaxID=135588 RepID=UPI00355A295D|nr:hypothetical protein GPJ56_003133 [Histomonas meleagridis]KAH0800629.1 hypothetical protein GO595_006382 [Histomonas meleagridis]